MIEDRRLTGPRSLHKAMRTGKRDLLPYVALLSLGASGLAACTGQWLYSPWGFWAPQSQASVSPPCPLRRVRARGPALSVANRNCRADYRGPLVGSAVLWPDQTGECCGWRHDRPMTRPMSLDTKRNARVRCAIYTRKSSEEGLEQEFNSLQAQREACEAFITSQRHEGWVGLRAGYDNGGFSGATMGRPALHGCSPTSRRGASILWSSTRSTG